MYAIRSYYAALALTSDGRIVYRADSYSSDSAYNVYACDPATGVAATWTANGVSSGVFCVGPDDELYWYNADEATDRIAEGVYRTTESYNFV